MTLTNPLHEQFAMHIAATGNAAEAARSIGYDRNARQRGSQLLRRPDVQARVEELLRDRPSLPTRLAQRLDAATLHRAAQAVAFLASLA
jgi:phage terminase small subunit